MSRKTGFFGIREIYASFILVATMIFVSIFTSVALFQKTIEKVGIASLIANEVNQVLSTDETDFVLSSDNSYGTITVTAGEKKFFDITVTNDKNISTKYKMYYKFTSGVTVLDVEVGISNLSSNPVSSTLAKSGENGDSKTVRVGIINNSSQDVSIDIGVQGGYVNNELTLLSGRNEMSTVSEADDGVIVVSNLSPIEEDAILTSAAKTTISIAKDSEDEDDWYARIDLSNIEISDNYKSYDVKWKLYQGEEKVTTGSFVQTLDGSDTINMANNVLVNSTTPIEYTLYIWIQDTDLDQSDLENGSLTANLQVTKNSTQSTLLVDSILGENGTAIIPLEPTFNSTSTDEGKYSQLGNYNVFTYYYRGNVTDNFVQFGTYKSTVTYEVYYMPDLDPNAEDSEYITVTRNADDPILWRIVRINEDGSIKLMSVDSVPASEMYNTHLSVDSTIDSMIQTSAFCIDDTNNFESVNTRVTNNEPVFTCQNGATIKTSKFGGLTVDEAMYGGLYNDSPMLSYISIPNGGVWSTHKTFLPNYSVIADEVNYLYSSTTAVDFDTIAPTVINVKADTIVNGGSGIEDDPYIID